MKKTSVLIMILIVIILVCLGLIGYKLINPAPKEEPKSEPQIKENLDFNSHFIREVNKLENGNYLVSPYSVEIALNMLKDGASGETKSQIENVLENRTINYINVKNRINVANAAFIKEEYKNNVKESYYKNIKEKYNGDILYDEFKTPKVMNDWVNKETYGMIKEIVKDIPSGFIMGIANAVAIDVDWDEEFDCQNTTEEDFTKEDKSKMKVPMMYKSYSYKDVKYFVNENEKGVVIPYKKYDKNGKEEFDSKNANIGLEFVGIIPNGDIKGYINSIDKNKLETIDNSLKESSDKTILNLSLPMFKYDYDMGDSFKEVLINMGIKNVFDGGADFTNIIDNPPVYIGKAIHKTYIDLNEKGTKAAAVTAFIPMETAMPKEEKPKEVKIEFNKPFVYMIRDSKTKEMLFFGVVQEPSEWEGPTCSEEDAA